MPKKTHNLHLTKPDVDDFAQILSEGASERLGEQGSSETELPEFGQGGRLYLFSGFPRTPIWLRDIQLVFGEEFNLRSQSIAGIIAFRTNDRFFAVTFGYGWSLLDPRVFERDFGIRASINALDVTKPKRLERTNLADALRASALSPFQRDFDSFGTDDALDLVRTISGKTTGDVTADNLAGSSSLKWNAEIGL